MTSGAFCLAGSLVTCAPGSDGCVRAMSTGCGAGAMCAGAYPSAMCKMPQPLGWYNDLGATDVNSPNYLVGVPVTVTAASVLHRFGLIVRSDAVGKHVQFGLYRDSGGGAGPGQLVAQTTGTVLLSGRNEIAPTVASVALAAGTYWLMAVFDQNTNVGHDTTTTGTWKYFMHAYGAALPNPISAPITTETSVANLNYYLLVF